MSDLYNGSPSSYGGFSGVVPGESSKAGYYQQPLNLPYFTGRSILATIPEYQRNPLALEKDILFELMEGRANMMRLLSSELESGGGISVKDVRYRIPVEVLPNQRVYLDLQTVASPTAAGISVFKIASNQTKIATAMPGGNPKQVGDIARLEVGQKVILMFSWVEPKSTSAVDSTKLTFYSSAAIASAPRPEVAKIVAVDYANSTITVERMWAGAQRTSDLTYTNILGFSVAADSAGTGTWSNGNGNATVSIPRKFAFLIPMAKSMPEDEIDAKVRYFSSTWKAGIVQRHLLAYGSQHFAEVISKNLGLPSPLAKSKKQTLIDYQNHWEWTSIYGEQYEYFNPATGEWEGGTDGLLANIPKSHYWAIKGIDYSSGFTGGSSANMGSFHPAIFNKLMQGKGYFGSGKKTFLCGEDMYTDFTTMINHMTQSVPDIKSEWRVEGKSFKTSGGLQIDVVPSDAMTLNGQSGTGILYDKAYFKPVKLENYPGMDIVEISNENPLKKNGFVHGVKSFLDLNPDAHWVFTLVPKTLPGGTSNATAYAALDALGSSLE